MLHVPFNHRVVHAINRPTASAVSIPANSLDLPVPLPHNDRDLFEMLTFGAFLRDGGGDQHSTQRSG